MSTETDQTIFEQCQEIKKSIDNLNENLSMIAYQLYISNHKGMEEHATIKNFLSDKEKLQKGE